MFPMLHTKPQAIDPSVPKNKIFKGFFYHIWPMCPSWSCDPDVANKLSFPRHVKVPFEITLWLAHWCQRRCLKSVDDGWADGQTDAGACLNYTLTYEPKGSDELINKKKSTHLTSTPIPGKKKKKKKKKKKERNSILNEGEKRNKRRLIPLLFALISDRHIIF